MKMNGILVIDKPSGKTSHDVVDMVRKATGIRKVGHTGTLDPMATGVLVLPLGQATRIARFLELEPKEYIAEAVFGISTNTQDITGDIIEESNAKPGRRQVEEIISKYLGTISQIPPMVSAVKIGGKPLYKLARQGKEVERKARNVTIYKLEMLDFFDKDDRSHAVFRVVCSGGTYVRTLVHDMGEELGTGATLSSLRRTRVGSYTLNNALSISDSSNKQHMLDRLVSMDDALSHLAGAVANMDAVRLVLNGREVDKHNLESHFGTVKAGEFVRIKSSEGQLLAVGQVLDGKNLKIKPEVVFK